MASAASNKEISFELLPVIRVYKDGHVERLMKSEKVPPSQQDPQTGVSSKDIIISQDPSISARLYLPNNIIIISKPNTQQNQKLPLLVYFHGGAFCIGSAFSFLHHRYLNILVSQANVIAVSVEYRLAPEHLLPTAYEDSWAALRWVFSHSKTATEEDGTTFSNGFYNEPWLIDHADFSRVYLGGDSAGANIAHHMAMHTGGPGPVGLRSIRGVFLVHPYFWGSNPVGSETDMSSDEKAFLEKAWKFVNPLSSDEGVDDRMINPFALGAPSLSGLGCERVLVCVAGKDMLRERGRLYCDELKKCGWEGEVELFEVEEEGHVFHIYNPATENAQLMIQRMVSFLNH